MSTEPTASVPASPSPGGAVDALILCALQDELDAVLASAGGAEAWEVRKDAENFRLHRRTLDNGRGGRLRVAVAWTGEMGRLRAASRAQQLIREVDPACVAMCGICAGDRSKVALGDVVVAERLWSPNEGSKEHVVEGKPAVTWHNLRTFDLEATWKMDAAFFAREMDVSALREARPRSRAYQRRWLLDALLAHEDGGVAPQDHAERKARCPDWREVVSATERAGLVERRGGKLSLTAEGRELAQNERVLNVDGIPEDPPFAVRVGAMATVDAVQEDRTLFERLRGLVRKTIAVEMEGTGVAEEAERAGRRSIVVKAVSDHADEEKDDSFQTFACRAAAEVLVAFLLKHLDPVDRTVDAKALMMRVDILVGEVEKDFEEDHRKATELFDAEQYEAARDAYNAMFERAKRMADATDRPTLREWAQKCLLNAAAATVNLQEMDEARSLLATVDASVLSPKNRLNLAEAEALVGAVEQAEKLMGETDVLDDESLQERVTEVRQRIAIRRGQVPDDLVSSRAVRVDAATALLGHGDSRPRSNDRSGPSGGQAGWAHRSFRRGRAHRCAPADHLRETSRRPFRARRAPGRGPSRAGGELRGASRTSPTAAHSAKPRPHRRRLPQYDQRGPAPDQALHR